jgi:hypothetical protein
MTIKRVLIVAALSAACGSSIEPKSETSQQDDAASESDAGTEPLDEALHEIEVDASSMTDFRYVDLESARVVNVKTPATSPSWDLGLRRFAIALNGGVSGSGGVEVSVVKDQPFAQVEDVPATFVTDVADGSDDDEDPDYVMSTGDTGWYDYNPSDHTLAPRAHVYIVKTVEQNVFKLEVLGYYNAAGSAGHMTLRFQLIERGG